MKEYNLEEKLYNIYNDKSLTEQEQILKQNEILESFRAEFKNNVVNNVIKRLEELYPKKTKVQKLKDYIYELTHIEFVS